MKRPWLVVSMLALFGVVLLGVFPVRAYLDQQHQRDELATRVETLAAENQRLVDLVGRLDANETIERLARERYHLVRPGEEAYAILPEAEPVPAVAPPAPAEAPPARGSWWSRAWSRITSIA